MHPIKQSIYQPIVSKILHHSLIWLYGLQFIWSYGQIFGQMAFYLFVPLDSVCEPSSVHSTKKDLQKNRPDSILTKFKYSLKKSVQIGEKQFNI